VNENVLAILAADKTIALGIVKPLYCSCFHDVAVFLLLKYALELAGYCRQITLRQVTLLERGTARQPQSQTQLEFYIFGANLLGISVLT
jgi:hypothetical protein